MNIKDFDDIIKVIICILLLMSVGNKKLKL